LLHQGLKDSTILIEPNSSDKLGLSAAKFCEFFQDGFIYLTRKTFCRSFIA